MLAQPAARLFGADTLRQIATVSETQRPRRVKPTSEEPIDWGDRHLIVHPVDRQRLLIEIEPAATAATPDEFELLALSGAFERATSIDELLEIACRGVGQALDYDRVLIYQVEQIYGPGYVRQEYTNGRLPSLMGLRFRPVDFPEEGYRLHERNPVFSFTLTEAAQPAVLGDTTGLEDALQYVLACRTAYPTLRRFLRESAIATQLSLALSVNGKVWGLLFAHASRPLPLDHRQRTFVGLVGEFMNRELLRFTLHQAQKKLRDADLLRVQIRESIARATDLVDGLAGSDPSLLEFLPEIRGVNIFVDGKSVVLGSPPSEAATRRLLQWTGDKLEGDEIYYTHHLRETYPRADELGPDTAGVLLVPLNHRRSAWIAWFRPERTMEVTYGSRMQEGEGAAGERFAPTVETQRGVSLPWTEEEVASVRDLQSFIRDVVLERYNHLTRVNQQLKSAYDEMEDFSYTVSHDLRAPLRGIDGFAEILMEDYGNQLSNGADELVRTIQYNAARMNQFISDILELSRIGRAPLLINDCDVRELVRRAVRQLTDQLGGPPIEVSVADQLPPLRGDCEQLGLVMRHLISNAAKYSGKQHKRNIIVGFREHDWFGNGQFYVSDNGIGIAKQHHERVFGMFNRLVTDDDYAGNGVGLALVKRIIQRHHGTVTIESELGQGATFLFNTDVELAE